MVTTKNGIKVFIDANAQMFLVNTVMDFREDDVMQGFVFENPNVAGACGCGESVTYDKEQLRKNAEQLSSSNDDANTTTSNSDQKMNA